KPILITENGIACKNDMYRIIYISAILQAVAQSMNMGVHVIGYLHWSLLDNWEWGTYTPTFGLASVDPLTYER
ncbi:family 1 glycosylhydrolase, partial [Coprobacillus cateniformis]|nr:family 1 glycosylhydrolase [Coprobacillus cateniformis]